MGIPVTIYLNYLIISRLIVIEQDVFSFRSGNRSRDVSNLAIRIIINKFRTHSTCKTKQKVVFASHR